MQTVQVDDFEVTIVFPGGVALEVVLAGKSVDVRARVKARAALVRAGVAAEPQITLDIVERHGPEE